LRHHSIMKENSVKGQLVAKFFAQPLGMDLFASKPELVQESNTFK